MSDAKPKPAMEYIVGFLRDHPQATYAEVKAGADQRGFQVFPIMFGRAQAILGLVKVAPRGSRRREAEAAAARASARPPVDPGTLDGLVKGIREQEQQRLRYRQALERVRQILHEALA